MKKYIKILAFQIGVDCLGFPLFCHHEKTDYQIVDSKYFKAFRK